MSRRPCWLVFAAILLTGCPQNGGVEAPLLNPGERVGFKLADNVKLVAGNSVQLAVAFEARDDEGNIRDLPCDHGKMIGNRKVFAHVQFYDEDDARMEYHDIDLTNH